MSQGNAVQILRSHGERITPVRLALLSILEKSKTPRTPQELLSELQAKGHQANKTTVYRQLETFVAYALVNEVHFADRIKRYELVRAEGHHHHLVCVQCGRIEDVSFPSDLQTQESAIARKYKFKVLHHSLEFFGLCKRCS